MANADAYRMTGKARGIIRFDLLTDDIRDVQLPRDTTPPRISATGTAEPIPEMRDIEIITISIVVNAFFAVMNKIPPHSIHAKIATG